MPKRADFLYPPRPSTSPAAVAMLHLRRRFLPLLRDPSHLNTAAAPSTSLHLRALVLSTSASAFPTPFSVEDYLVATCGLTGAQALKASKKLPRLKSASNPDAVLALLSGVGLSRPDIATIVAADPLLLISRVGNVAPRLASLRDRVGLSHRQIARFLLVGGSVALRSCDVASKLEFWIPFVGTFDKLLRIVRWNRSTLSTDLEKVVKPNIALLRECGLSVCDIVNLSMHWSRLLVSNPERMKAFVLRADKLGVPRSSYNFKYAVVMASYLTEDKVAARTEFLRSTLGCSMDKFSVMVCRYPYILTYSEEYLRCKIEFLRSTLGCSKDKLGIAVCKHPKIIGLSEEKLRCKMEFLRSTLGCSKDKLGAAFCKQPQILALSVEKLRHKIEFMVTKVGLEPEYIVDRPLLLNFSLEKRLVPRHYVVKVLQVKGLMKISASFYSIFSDVDKDFIAKYIDCHKDAVPGLAGAYAAVCAGKVPTEVED